MAVLTIASDMQLSLDRSFWAAQGEIVTMTVSVASALRSAGRYLFLDLILPDGSRQVHGGFDLGSVDALFYASFYSGKTIAGVAANGVLRRDGMLCCQAIISSNDTYTALDTEGGYAPSSDRRTILQASRKYYWPITKSVLAISGNNIEPIIPVVTDIFGFSCPSVGGCTVYRRTTPAMAAVDDTAIAGYIRGSAYWQYRACRDDDYLYILDNTQYPYSLGKYDFDMNKVDSLAFESDADLETICESGDYLYVGQYIPMQINKISKATLEVVDTLSMAHEVIAMITDDTYLYMALNSTPDYIEKYDLATLTLQATSSAPTSGYTLRGLTCNDNQIITIGYDTKGTIAVYNKSDLAFVIQTSLTGIIPAAVLADNDFAYVTHSNNRFCAYELTYLSVASEYYDIGVVGYCMTEDNDNFYVGTSANTILRIGKVSLEVEATSDTLVDDIVMIV